MNEERFADLFQVKTVSSRNLKPGDRIDARVADISGENIFLDVGGKSEGVLAAAEVRNPDGRIDLKPGDTVKVYLPGRSRRRDGLYHQCRLKPCLPAGA